MDDPPSRDETRTETPAQREQALSSRETTRDEPTALDDQTSGGYDWTRAAYLAEKNQLLNERIADLEATLEQKNDRIADLEADKRALRESLAACEE